MSRAFLDRNSQNDANSNDKKPSQPKVDYQAQMKKLDMYINNPGWNTSDISPAQMFAEEEEERQAKANEEELQMKPGEEEELQKKEGSGNPGTKTNMPNDVQSKMENSFGEDFSDVNIHKDSEQAPSLGALAYTQGNDVHFAPGQYDPSSQKGQELLGHELSHVVQQREGRVKPTTQGKGMPVNTDPALEKEADEQGKQAAQGKMADVKGRGSGVQREEEKIERSKFITYEVNKETTVWDLITEHWWKIDTDYMQNAADELITANDWPKDYNYKIQPNTKIQLPIPIGSVPPIVVRPDEFKEEEIFVDEDTFTSSSFFNRLTDIYDEKEEQMKDALKDFELELEKGSTQLDIGKIIREDLSNLLGYIPYAGPAISGITGSSVWSEIEKIDESKKENNEKSFIQDYLKIIDKIDNVLNGIRKEQSDLYGIERSKIKDLRKKRKFERQIQIELGRAEKYIRLTTKRNYKKLIIKSFLDQIKNPKITMSFHGDWNNPWFAGDVKLTNTDHDEHLPEYINGIYKGIPIPIYDFGASFEIWVPNILGRSHAIKINSINSYHDELATILNKYWYQNGAKGKNVGKIIKKNGYYLPLPKQIS